MLFISRHHQLPNCFSYKTVVCLNIILYKFRSAKPPKKILNTLQSSKHHPSTSLEYRLIKTPKKAHHGWFNSCALTPFLIMIHKVMKMKAEKHNRLWLLIRRSTKPKLLTTSITITLIWINLNKISNYVLNSKMKKRTQCLRRHYRQHHHSCHTSS